MNFAAKISKLDNELKNIVGKKLRSNANHDNYKDYFDLDIRVENKKDSKKEQYLDGYSKKTEKIKEHLDMLGFFALIITTKPHTTEETLMIYRGRDNVEKLFRSIKSGMDFDTPGVHSDKTLTSKVHLMFLSAIIWNRLLQISKVIKKTNIQQKRFHSSWNNRTVGKHRMHTKKFFRIFAQICIDCKTKINFGTTIHNGTRH